MSFFEGLDRFSKKTDNYIEIGELIFEAKLIEKEICDKKFLLGCLIYDWYCDKCFDIKEIPRLCKEIAEKEKQLHHIHNRIKELKKK